MIKEPLYVGFYFLIMPVCTTTIVFKTVKTKLQILCSYNIDNNHHSGIPQFIEIRKAMLTL